MMRARSGQADERTGADEAVGRTGGRVDGAERARTSKRADARTRGRGLHCADGGSDGRADWAVKGRRATVGRTRSPLVGRTGGRVDSANGRTRSPPVGRTGGRANEWVGLGLKGHIPRGPFHSWAPSPLASLERECLGCLGVQWGPIGFHVNPPYLAPGLPCLV